MEYFLSVLELITCYFLPAVALGIDLAVEMKLSWYTW